ncbi:hypothetical protein [Actinoallomurus acaciae]|uniref:Uncharacterized protein n=1 Tax=Actinoallomurus acaciae TaxID=502577 RepID=A0ABV5YS26_9ACTN
MKTQDDSAIRPAAQRFMGWPAEGWIWVQHWEDFFDEIKSLQPGAAAFVVEGIPGAMHHAFAVVHTSDEGLQIVETRKGTAWTRPADAERMRVPLEVRALIIDSTGKVRVGRGLPLASQSIARSITDPSDFRVGAVGVEIETDFTLDWQYGNRIQIERLATSALVSIDADSYMGVPYVEIIGQPTRALPGENRASHDAVWGEIHRVWRVLDDAEEDTHFAKLFPTFEVEEEVDEFEVTVSPPPSSQAKRRRRFDVQFSVGIAPFSESRYLEFTAKWRRTGSQSDMASQHARAGLRIGETFAAHFASVSPEAVQTDLALDYDTQSLFGHVATLYTQVAAQLEGAVKDAIGVGDRGLWKNNTIMAGRTNWRAKLEYLPHQLRAFLESQSSNIRTSFEQEFSSYNKRIIDHLRRSGYEGSLWDLPATVDGKTIDHVIGQFLENGITLNAQTIITPYRSLGIRNYFTSMDRGGEGGRLEPKVSVWEIRLPPQGSNLAEIEEHYRRLADFSRTEYERALQAFSISPRSDRPVAEIPFDVRDKKVGHQQLGLIQEIAKFIAQEAIRRRAGSMSALEVFIEGGGRGGFWGNADKAGNDRAVNVRVSLEETVADLIKRRGRYEPIATFITFNVITRGKSRSQSPYPLILPPSSDDELRRVVIWVAPKPLAEEAGVVPGTTASQGPRQVFRSSGPIERQGTILGRPDGSSRTAGNSHRASTVIGEAGHGLYRASRTVPPPQRPDGWSSRRNVPTYLADVSDAMRNGLRASGLTGYLTDWETSAADSRKAVHGPGNSTDARPPTGDRRPTPHIYYDDGIVWASSTHSEGRDCVNVAVLTINQRL